MLEVLVYQYAHANLRILAVHIPPLDNVSYLVFVAGQHECMVIDPAALAGWEELLAAYQLVPRLILLTHEHIDHISGVNALIARYGCRLLCHARCAEHIKDPRRNLAHYFEALLEMHGAAEPERYARLIDYQVTYPAETYTGRLNFSWQGLPVTLQEAPGHSAGGSCIRVADVLFSGDNLLRDTPVFTILPGGSKKLYQAQTEPLLRALPPEMYVYPGHGARFQLRDGAWR